MMEDEAPANVMVEGRDYTVDARGRWVFSRSYLLGRGKCCGSKCQNCPYGLSPHDPPSDRTGEREPRRNEGANDGRS